MASSEGQNVQFPPFRGLQDFLLDSRFQLPSFNDQSRWANRVLNNLLYYQANYFAVVLLAIALIGLIFPAEFLYGIVGTLCAILTAVVLLSKHHLMRQLRGSYPWAALAIVAVLGFVVVTELRDIAVFAFPFAFSVLLIYIHASLRTRNIKNRFNNKMEQMGLKRSPMGMLIELTGYEIQMRLFTAAEDATM
ncbi:PRA1 family protein 2-like [Paramacrobiotus metropolitanus]|uniref:PRA1 family protein 2-like n=1 Tax=Paramacrobiotus metropolitanus TaxID=2943436 RepID=UPI002445CFF2|nr:PRA1 family protein 2-like [Paramacrobiotus metropolitanus]